MADDELRRVVRRLVPGGALLDDRQSWAPKVPHDLNAPPPAIAADGTSACEVCAKKLPLAQLEITAYGYRCAACASVAVKLAAPADLDNVKIGRGRWWLMPIVFAVGGAFMIIAPAISLVVTMIVAGVVFRFFVRRGF